jgi:hypothetical protein
MIDETPGASKDIDAGTAAQSDLVVIFLPCVNISAGCFKSSCFTGLTVF